MIVSTSICFTQANEPTYQSSAEFHQRPDYLMGDLTQAINSDENHPKKNEQDASEKSPAKRFAENVVVAWKCAGGQAGWLDPRRFGDFGGFVFLESTSHQIPAHAIPTFRLREFDPARALELPKPAGEFGLDLRNINLGNANITLLKKLKGLVALDLTSTEPTDRLVSQISRLVSLRVLSLHLGLFNIKETTLAKLESLRQLESLDLGNTLATDKTVEMIASMPQIRVLGLANTQITLTGFAQLRELEHLEVLDVSSNDVTDAWLAGITNCKNLHTLNLGATKVGDEGLAGISDLDKLMRLDLVATRVSDSAIGELCRLKNLKWLNVHACQLSEQSKKRLTTALPDCDIFY